MRISHRNSQSPRLRRGSARNEPNSNPFKPTKNRIYCSETNKCPISRALAGAERTHRLRYRVEPMSLEQTIQSAQAHLRGGRLREAQQELGRLLEGQPDHA